MRKLKIIPLENDRVAQCFPLVRLALPGLSVAEWAGFARDHLSLERSESGGILLAQIDASCILGLIVYDFELAPGQGRVLRVKHLIVHDYFASGRKMVERSLIDAAEDLARRNDCTAINFTVPLHSARPPAFRPHKELESLGHEMDSVRYCKTLPDLGLGRRN